ncbi:MAG: tRNA-2-methylthio-N(6)-dimethylallyladenosine synthase [Holosporales bacterium]|jgi:tRNA-2-methylthio-N6-dimethylallyladenosine synthase|nr:tRNA-2-methylthio-N(6)-dimethylallyladenosine synthase [Holosporales bacterium]
MEGLRFYIKTYGCQMNVYDSDKISLLLTQNGFVCTQVLDDADIVILNTCHIREKAKHKIYTELGYLRIRKEARTASGKYLLIAVGGCVAQAEGRRLTEAAPFVDIVFGTQTYHLLPDMIEAALDNRGGEYVRSGELDNDLLEYPRSRAAVKASPRLVNISLSDEDKFQFLPNSTSSNGAAFLAIQEGCNKFCTYCVVPYTRGREISRDAPSILHEAQLMAKSGVREITLLGQNVNAYNWKDSESAWSFASLVRKVCEIDGIQRVFYTSSHPVDVTLDAIKAHAELPQLMPFWHLPVQSGSTRVLGAMNRHYSADDYKRMIDTIRQYNPNIAMCSDFIVGFPDETEEDFEQTLDLVRYVNYAQAFSFKYSPRPNTVAAGMSNQIDEEIKSERLQRLQDLLRQQQTQFNKQCVGTTLSVMFQKYGKEPNQILGKSQFMQSVVVHTTSPDQYFNLIRDVKITGATLSSLEGEIIS